MTGLGVGFMDFLENVDKIAGMGDYVKPDKDYDFNDNAQEVALGESDLDSD